MFWGEWKLYNKTTARTYFEKRHSKKKKKKHVESECERTSCWPFFRQCFAVHELLLQSSGQVVVVARSVPHEGPSPAAQALHLLQQRSVQHRCPQLHRPVHRAVLPALDTPQLRAEHDLLGPQLLQSRRAVRTASQRRSLCPACNLQE